MREIKFRGKHTNYRIWIYGSLLNINDRYHILGKNDIVEDGHHIRQESDISTCVDEDTIGQFIEHKDCKGFDIYDGDILFDGFGYFLVYYDKYNCCFSLRYLGYDIVRSFKVNPISTMEIVGNEFDNPELLKGKEVNK